MAEAAQAWHARGGAILFERGPRAMAVLVFLAGGLALVSAALPGSDLAAVSRAYRPLTELPGYLLAMGGLALMTLSTGLLRRVRAAWLLTLLVVVHGLFLATVFKPRPVEAAMYLSLAVLLLSMRRAFFRKSALSRISFSWTWTLATTLALAVAAFAALLWISHRAGFLEASFHDLILDAELGIAGRPVALALMALLVGSVVWLASNPARRRADPPGDEDMRQVAACLAAAESARPEAVLALAGDKHIFLSPDGAAAIAFGEIGPSRIALGAPLGPKTAWEPALRAFCDAAQRDAMQPAVYAAPPEALPILFDLGFKAEKVGENAILDLTGFSLSGRKREVIRRGRRKLAERHGATFTLSLPPHDPSLLARLKPVSDAWLEANGGHEKGFSLGAFEPGFLKHCPIGVAELDGQAVAFGSLLVTPDRVWAGIDLMRYDPDRAVTNTMDFLLVELILWAQSAGYRWFDLAMAPLSGLVEARHAPVFARIGQLIFERGERFYNFQGLRRFKEKFGPDWEPRYIAAPREATLLAVLARVAQLTSRAPDLAARDGPD